MTPPKLLPALLGGLFLGVLSALPIVGAANVCCCLWVVLGGALAAYVMQQNHATPITLGDGALVGLLAGVFGSVIGVVVSAVITMLTGGFEGFAPGSMPTEGMTPEMRDMLARISPAVLFVIGSIVWFFVSLLFSTLGGLIGAAIFKKPTPPGASVPPFGGGPGGTPAWGVPPGPTPPPAPMPPPPPFAPPTPPAPPIADAPVDVVREPVPPVVPAVPDVPVSGDEPTRLLIRPIPPAVAPSEPPPAVAADHPETGSERPISGESDPDRRG